MEVTSAYTNLIDSIGSNETQECDLAEAKRYYYLYPDDLDYRATIQATEEHIRDLSVAVFDEKNLPHQRGCDISPETITSNRNYWEAWLSIREQLDSEQDVNFPAIESLLRAKQLFAKAWQQSNETKRLELLKLSLEKLAVETLDGPMTTRLQNPTISRVTAKMLKARLLHDLADTREFKNDGRAAKEMSISDLWECADEIHQISDKFLPPWAKQHYLNEIEYFRGKYSEEIGINPNLDPRTIVETEQTLDTHPLAKVALADSGVVVTLQHAA